MATCLSATAAVRFNLGSTTTIFAPFFCRALIAHLNPQG